MTWLVGIYKKHLLTTGAADVLQITIIILNIMASKVAVITCTHNIHFLATGRVRLHVAIGYQTTELWNSKQSCMYLCGYTRNKNELTKYRTTTAINDYSVCCQLIMHQTTNMCLVIWISHPPIIFSIRKVLRYVSTALAKNSVAEIGCHSRVKKGKVAQRSGITYSKNSTTHGHNIINDN